ncbi:hypothetical protein P872_11760 [Rhodonellum psychrophilum GCM71 = DSM 17998]|uniref:DUF1574 domain-containing protein n=2 Tax=Rhodonellum TaxID=336827 RepID=U5BWJ5_9BACT|nr:MULTISPECIES: hypothetical protein [Rhodonellum]ERM80976.1 hypothetical protein P872_11760 [Rhodonellum psychrophilum GCM71 = DSM 17998]SDZ55366.1 hypothetical protein SAMN05444412_12340 [Rhodonellum ikkaensis]
MNQFLFKLFGIFSFLLVIIYGVDYLIQEGVKTSNYRQISKWNDIVNGELNAELLIVGSSRAYVHFDPEFLDNELGMSCYNLGFDGSFYELQKLMLDLYLRKNEIPKTLIWVLDLNSFESKDEFYGFEQLIPFKDLPEIQKMLEINKVTPSILYEFPLVRYKFNEKIKVYGILNYFNLYGSERNNKNGFKRNNSKWDGTFENVKKDYPNGIKQVLKENLFNEFLKTCQSLEMKGIKVFWVFAPMYQEGFSLITNYKEILNFYTLQASQNNYKLFDFSKSSINLDKTNFYNANHLNGIGIDKFMLEFRNEFIEVNRKKE